MSSDGFRRHARARVDAAVHRAFRVVGRHHELLERLLHAVRPAISVRIVGAVARMVPFAREMVRAPEGWRATPAHELAVVHGIAGHLFGPYPVPRFLASAWLEYPGAPHRWFLAHARGQRMRSLELPIALTRRMEHELLRTPDHWPLMRALRRAEVLGLGGREELAEHVARGRLGEDFGDGERWRRALAWLAGCGDAVDLARVDIVIDYLADNRIELPGRTFASVLRLAAAWNGWVRRRSARCRRWPAAPWAGMREREADGVEWQIVELLDSDELADEGVAMHHCVRSYWHECSAGVSAIYSVRRRGPDGTPRSRVTFEVRKASGVVHQVKGFANRPVDGKPLALVTAWAARHGLRMRA